MMDSKLYLGDIISGGISASPQGGNDHSLFDLKLPFSQFNRLLHAPAAQTCYSIAAEVKEFIGVVCEDRSPLCGLYDAVGTGKLPTKPAPQAGIIKSQISDRPIFNG